MNKDLTALEAFNKGKKNVTKYDHDTYDHLIEIGLKKSEWNIIEKSLKALELIKKNLIVGYDKDKNGRTCLILCVKITNNNLVVIYETFDEKEAELLKEVLK